MQAGKVAKLRTMEERGGTKNEREVARRMLDEAGIKRPGKAVAVVKPPQWHGDGVMRLDSGPPITTSQIRHLLNHIQENTPFTYKNIPMVTFFGSGHFYLIINFLSDNKLIRKQGSKYTIDNKAAIRAQWNKLIESARL